MHIVQTHFEKLISTFEALCDLIGNMDPSRSAYILLSDESGFYFLRYLSFLFEVLGEVNQTQMYFHPSGIRL